MSVAPGGAHRRASLFGIGDRESARIAGLMLDSHSRRGYSPRLPPWGSPFNAGPLGPKGEPMLRWGIVLVAAVALGVATEARAQLPRGNGQVQFVPIDTTKNLATPIPTVAMPQTKDSYFDRLYNSLASVLPFPKRNRRA